MSVCRLRERERMSKSVYVCVCFMTVNYWDMLFVVRSNDSFNFPLGWILLFLALKPVSNYPHRTPTRNDIYYYYYYYFLGGWGGGNVYMEECSQYRYSSIVNSDIKVEMSAFDSDNAPLDLIHLAKTAPPELTKTRNHTKLVTITVYFTVTPAGTLLCQGRDCPAWDSRE